MSRIVHHRLAILLTALFAVSYLTGCNVVKAEVTVVKNGKPLATIYHSGPAELPEYDKKANRWAGHDKQYERSKVEALYSAVEDLQHHLQKMSGVELPVVATDNPADVKAPAIVIGELANKLGATPTGSTQTGDAFRLICKEGMLLLGGESNIGASHAMYHWLRSLGCEWIMPGEEGEVIPTLKTVQSPAMDVDKTPAFEVRAPWYSGGPNIIEKEEHQLFEQWKRRQAQSHGRVYHPDMMWGGHMWASLLSRYRKEFEADPTMYALVRQPDGSYKRGKSQVNALHPGIIDMTIRYIDELFERYKWPADMKVAISIGPNDGGGYDESAESIGAGAGRFDPMTGGRDETDVLIKYANTVLEKIEKKYPNLKLGFYIYSVHAEYPMRYTPHPKFVAHFADITYSRYHSLTDRESFTRNYYRNILEQWANLHEKQGNPMWFYGYNWNLAENWMPYSKLHIWGKDMPYYHKMGVIGHNNEQDKAWANLGPHNYLMARQGWDIDITWQEALATYCDKAFGKGSKHLQQYYTNLVQAQKDADQEAGSYHAIANVLDREFVAESKALFAKAAAAADTPYHKKMVDYYSEPVGMLEHYLNYRDAVNSFDFVAGRKHYENMLAHYEKYMAMNTNLVSRYGHRYASAWMYGPYTEKAKQYSTDPYKIIHKIPDELPTILDPENRGALMGMYEPDRGEDGLIKTKTFSTSWEDQGLGFYRDGGVWYRVRFPVDKSLDGQAIGLMIGSIEDRVHIWINGEYVGNGRGFIRPFLFDLTEHIKYGEENMIAIQVIRAGKLNETGLGGLIFPSYIFTGPQLEQKAPAREPMQRILPGGARGVIEE